MPAGGGNKASGAAGALAILLMLSALAAGAQTGQPAGGGQAMPAEQAAAGAQTAPAGQAPRTAPTAQAILERGPVAVRGLPFFPPNVLEAQRAEYLAGQSLIEVYFTREPLVLPAGWRLARCGQEALRQVQGQDSPTFCYVEPGGGGYALFFTFEAEDFPWCAWTRAFLQSLRSLLSFSQGQAEVPFPAILDY